MPVVLDTNILASIALTPSGSKLSIIAECWKLELLQVYISESIFTELERTLFTVPYFSNRLNPEDISDYLKFVKANTITQVITTDIDHEKIIKAAWRDINIEDDLVIATALDAKVKYLVTGDKALASLWTYQDLQIISPSNFVEVLDHLYNE
ncbi:MAG: putative toxin-antitoxin system toxin component, PIN family [Ktedonobacteraceae bacterium]